MSNEEQQLRSKIENMLKQRASKSNFVESPFTGDMIPMNEISDHIRIMLLNPQWKEQKELLMDKMRATSFADNRDIVKNLGKFNEKRKNFNDAKRIKEIKNIKIENLKGFRVNKEEKVIKKIIKQTSNEIKVIIRFPNGVNLTHETENITIGSLKLNIYKKIKKIVNINKCLLMTSNNQIMKDKYCLSKYNIRETIFLKY